MAIYQSRVLYSSEGARWNKGLPHKEKIEGMLKDLAEKYGITSLELCLNEHERLTFTPVQVGIDLEKAIKQLLKQSKNQKEREENQKIWEDYQWLVKMCGKREFGFKNKAQNLFIDGIQEMALFEGDTRKEILEKEIFFEKERWSEDDFLFWEEWKMSSLFDFSENKIKQLRQFLNKFFDKSKTDKMLNLWEIEKKMDSDFIDLIRKVRKLQNE